MIDISRVSKTYGENPALRSVSLTVNQGEIFGLLGPNGAGKTTLLGVITGLIAPDSGQIAVEGKDVRRHRNAVRRMIGYVPQDIAVYPDVSARENVSFFGRLYGLSGDALRTAVDRALEFVGLETSQRKTPATFSGGMKRRLNIACGIVHRPKLLLLDEPTVGIDPQSRNHILSSVEQLGRDGCTVVYTSHYMEEVERICSRVAILDHGQVIAEGTLYELKSLVTDSTTYSLTMKQPVQIDEAELRRIPGVEGVTVSDHTITVTSELEAYNIDQIVGSLSRRGVVLRSVMMEQPSLETVFLHMTGRTLRDGEPQ